MNVQVPVTLREKLVFWLCMLACRLAGGTRYVNGFVTCQPYDMDQRCMGVLWFFEEESP